MSQLQHNMWAVAARSAVLSVITGGGKWVEIKVHADPLHQHLIMTAERNGGEAVNQIFRAFHTIKGSGAMFGFDEVAAFTHHIETLLDQVRETPYGPVTNRPYATFSRSPCGYNHPDPGLGEHSFEVLADWGVDPDRIASLSDEGVVMVLC